jgi:hypothetical protein
MDRALHLLNSVMFGKVEDALTDINGDSEHRVYDGSNREIYVVMEEVPDDRSVILERYSDGKTFVVEWTVTVRERD